MTPVDPGICTHHGAQPSDRFCPDCGAAIVQAQRAAPSQAKVPSPEQVVDTDTFAAEGQVRQNQTYIGNRLMFTRGGDVETSFANIVSGQLIWQHFKSVLITQVVVAILFNVISAIVLVVTGLSSLQTLGYPGATDGLSGALTALVVLYVLVAVGLLVAAFSGWSQQPMSEWELLLDRRAVSQDSAYAAIVVALRQRNVPAGVGPRRILLDAATQRYGSYLVVSSDPYFIYVSVLPYGDGLYLGWSMWREQRVTRLYLEWFRQLRTRWAGGGSLIGFLLQAETARALRETVHNAVRDGVETAIAQQHVDLASAFESYPPPVAQSPMGAWVPQNQAHPMPYQGPPPQYGHRE